MAFNIHKKLLIIIGCCVSLLGISQNQSVSEKKVRPAGPLLQIGDKAPDILFENMMNFPTKNVRLSEFKDKVVLLDFWYTRCTSCIQGFPNVDSLQQKYRDRLQVVLVNSKRTGDNEVKVKAFFAKFTINEKPRYNFPTTIKDTLIDRLFNPSSFPHYVWLRNGKVIAYTGSDEVTGDNIEAVYAGKAVPFHMKKIPIDYDKQVPLFIHGNGGTGRNILYRSLLTGFAEGLSSLGSQTINKDSLVTKYTIINKSMTLLYSKAYNVTVPPSHILLDIKNTKLSNKDYRPKIREVDERFCYEIITPPITFEKMYKKMREDLYNYFGCSAILEKRMVKCFILKHVSSDTIAVDRSRKPYADVSTRYERNNLYNQPVSYLCGILQEFMNVPVFDETNYNRPIDIQFTINFKNTNAVQAALKSYGLELTETEREIEMFVISDKK